MDDIWNYLHDIVFTVRDTSIKVRGKMQRRSVRDPGGVNVAPPQQVAVLLVLCTLWGIHIWESSVAPWYAFFIFSSVPKFLGTSRRRYNGVLHEES
jgi:hypothetical protein